MITPTFGTLPSSRSSPTRRAKSPSSRPVSPNASIIGMPGPSLGTMEGDNATVYKNFGHGAAGLLPGEGDAPPPQDRRRDGPGAFPYGGPSGKVRGKRVPPPSLSPSTSSASRSATASSTTGPSMGSCGRPPINFTAT